MGVVYNRKIDKKEVSCAKRISRQVPLKALTRQNIQFLASLGLRVRRGVN